MDNCLEIFFLLSREHKRGHKEVDHLLPFLFLLGKNKKIKFAARGIIYGYESIIADQSDQRIQALSNLSNVELLDAYNIDNWLIRKIRNWREKKLYNRFINSCLTTLTLLLKQKYKKLDDAIDWQKIVGKKFINAKKPIILTLNLTNDLKKAIDKVKTLNPSAKWVFIPHGAILSDNRMLFHSTLEKEYVPPVNRMYSVVDHLLFTSQRDYDEALSAGLAKEKGVVIGSPRFCSEWIDQKKILKLDGPLPPTGKSERLNFLFFIPKSFINIFHEELIRTIDFISSYPEIDLILNRSSTTYPKLPQKILCRSNISDCLIGGEYKTGALIDWADIIIHVGTGIIFEPLIKNKILVFPRYLTCNTLICEQYNSGWTLKNRDDLRNLCNMAVHSSIEYTQNEYFKRYEDSNRKYINDFVYGNGKSVSDNIYSFFKNYKA